MSEPTVTPEVVPVEAPPVPPTPVELPEQRYEYQNRDEQGRPIGGKQVIIYRTEEEFREKFVAKEELLVRKLREVTRKQKLGITDDEPITNDAQRFENLAEFKPRELTPEERFNLSQDLQDPAKSVDAVNQMLEATIGMSAEKLRTSFNNQQMLTMQLMARANYDTFAETHKDDFYPCQDNKQVLTDWMVKKGLSPTVENFTLALSKLEEAGLLSSRPTVREETPVQAVVPPAPVSTEPNSQVPVVPEARISPDEQPQTKRQGRVPSSLNARVASDSSEPGPKTILSMVDIDNMPSEEYRKKLRDPAFRKLVEELENQASARRKSNV